MQKEDIKAGDEIFYAGNFYEVAEIKLFPHGKMIGIFDEKPYSHIDYLNPSSVFLVAPCSNCQGGGCSYCNGFGKIVY